MFPKKILILILVNYCVVSDLKSVKKRQISTTSAPSDEERRLDTFKQDIGKVGNTVENLVFDFLKQFVAPRPPVFEVEPNEPEERQSSGETSDSDESIPSTTLNSNNLEKGKINTTENVYTTTEPSSTAKKVKHNEQSTEVTTTFATEQYGTIEPSQETLSTTPNDVQFDDNGKNFDSSTCVAVTDENGHYLKEPETTTVSSKENDVENDSTTKHTTTPKEDSSKFLKFASIRGWVPKNVEPKKETHYFLRGSHNWKKNHRTKRQTNYREQQHHQQSQNMNTYDWVPSSGTMNCPPKSAKEDKLEKLHIQDLKQEVQKLQEMVDLIKDQQKLITVLDKNNQASDGTKKPVPPQNHPENLSENDVAHILHQLQQNEKNAKSSSDLNLKENEVLERKKHEELELIKHQLRNAILNLNQTRTLLGLEQQREVILERELTSQKSDITWLKNSMEQLMKAKNITGFHIISKEKDQIVGGPQTHFKTAHNILKHTPKNLPHENEIVHHGSSPKKQPQIEKQSRESSPSTSGENTNPKSRASDFSELEKLLDNIDEKDTKSKTLDDSAELQLKMLMLEKELKKRKEKETLAKQLKSLQTKIKKIETTDLKSKTLDTEGESLSQLKKLLKSLDKPQPKTEDELFAQELLNLQKEIKKLQPKEENNFQNSFDDQQSKNEDAQFQIMLNKLLSNGGGGQTSFDSIPSPNVPQNNRPNQQQLNELKRRLMLMTNNGQSFNNGNIGSFGSNFPQNNGYSGPNNNGQSFGPYNNHQGFYPDSSYNSYDSNKYGSNFGSYGQNSYNPGPNGYNYQGSAAPNHPIGSGGSNGYNYQGSAAPNHPIGSGGSNGYNYQGSAVPNHPSGSGGSNGYNYQGSAAPNNPSGYFGSSNSYQQPQKGGYQNGYQATPQTTPIEPSVYHEVPKPEVQKITYDDNFFLAPQPPSGAAPQTSYSNGASTYGEHYEQPKSVAQQSFAPEYTKQKVQDLKTQINGLQSAINNLNRPEYPQSAEDKATLYNLERQISELKSIVSVLNQNGGPDKYTQPSEYDQNISPKSEPPKYRRKRNTAADFNPILSNSKSGDSRRLEKGAPIEKNANTIAKNDPPAPQIEQTFNKLVTLLDSYLTSKESTPNPRQTFETGAQTPDQIQNQIETIKKQKPSPIKDFLKQLLPAQLLSKWRSIWSPVSSTPSGNKN